MNAATTLPAFGSPESPERPGGSVISLSELPRALQGFRSRRRRYLFDSCFRFALAPMAMAAALSFWLVVYITALGLALLFIWSRLPAAKGYCVFTDAFFALAVMCVFPGALLAILGVLLGIVFGLGPYGAFWMPFFALYLLMRPHRDRRPLFLQWLLRAFGWLASIGVVIHATSIIQAPGPLLATHSMSIPGGHVIDIPWNPWSMTISLWLAIVGFLAAREVSLTQRMVCEWGLRTDWSASEFMWALRRDFADATLRALPVEQLVADEAFRDDPIAYLTRLADEALP